MHSERIGSRGYLQQVTTIPPDPEVLSSFRDQCRRILSGAERPYDVAGELMALIAKSSD